MLFFHASVYLSTRIFLLKNFIFSIFFMPHLNIWIKSNRQKVLVHKMPILRCQIKFSKGWVAWHELDHRCRKTKKKLVRNLTDLKVTKSKSIFEARQKPQKTTILFIINYYYKYIHLFNLSKKIRNLFKIVERQKWS